MKKIAILTSGGDAPGMNAAIRAAARQAHQYRWAMVGVRNGYQGLMEADFTELGPRQVGGILQQGGTVLGSARSLDFKTQAGRQRALDGLAQAGIAGLIVVGGNGSQTGADALNKMGFPTVGIASTIDNDLVGSDITIGVDTALNIALEAIDRLKVTAASHKRAFLVEVMGRDCGYLALMAAIAGGAEAVCIPEIETHPSEIAKNLLEGWEAGKRNGLVVVAEGAKYDAAAIEAWFAANRTDVGFQIRSTILGHVQRGGTPTASDRILASQLGAAAARILCTGQPTGVLVGIIAGKVTTTPLAQIAGITKAPDIELMKLAETLAL